MPAPPAVAAGAKRLDAIRLRIFIENDVRFCQKISKPGSELHLRVAGECREHAAVAHVVGEHERKRAVDPQLSTVGVEIRASVVVPFAVDVGLCKTAEALTDSLGSDLINSKPFSCVSVNQADTTDTR